MTLSNREQQLITESLNKANLKLMADWFYERLFEVAPEIKPLFANTDTLVLKRKFIHTLSYLVSTLDTPEELKASLQALATRHVYYRVEEYQYRVVGNVLIWVLAKGIGDSFTDEIKVAWVKLYRLVEQTMIESAY